MAVVCENLRVIDLKLRKKGQKRGKKGFSQKKYCENCNEDAINGSVEVSL